MVRHMIVPSSVGAWLLALPLLHAGPPGGVPPRADGVTRAASAQEGVKPSRAREAIADASEDASNDAAAKTFRLELITWGRADVQTAVPSPSRRVQANEVQLCRPGIVEWYRWDARGVEHGFTLNRAPDLVRDTALAVHPLVLTLRAHGGYSATVSSNGSECLFRAETGTASVLYAGLATTDANGVILPSRMVAYGDQLAIEVDDTCAQYPLVIDPWIITQEAILLGGDTTAFDSFGRPVAISSDTVVVGAPSKTNGGFSGAGAAYVFVRIGTSWVEQAKLLPSDPEQNASFGVAVAIHGDTIVVGANLKDEASNANAGAAYVFSRSGASWTQQAKLVAGDPAAQAGFGQSLSLMGSTIAVGAAGAPSPFGIGAVYVYESSSGVWTQQAKLVSGAPRLGESVALFGGRIVAGAPTDSSLVFGAGSVRVFVRNGLSWTQEARIRAPDPGFNAFFGFFVAMWDDQLAVSAPNASTGVPWKSGAVYMYKRTGTMWSFVQKLLTPDAGNPATITGPLSLRPDRLAVGASSNQVGSLGSAGKVYLFENDPAGWRHTTTLIAAAPRDTEQFGAGVAQDGDTLVVGNNHMGPNPMRRAYVYRMQAENAFCFGDGSLATPCPCAPPDFVPVPSGGAGAGCANAFDLAGARLGVGGLVSPDTLTFRASIGEGYGGFAFLVKGDGRNLSGVASDDGVRCVDGSMIRFGGHNAGTNGEPFGAWAYPNSAQTTAVSIVTGQSPGQSSYYQVLYRHAVSGFCSPGTTNWTNAVQIDW